MGFKFWLENLGRSQSVWKMRQLGPCGHSSDSKVLPGISRFTHDFISAFQGNKIYYIYQLHKKKQKQQQPTGEKKLVISELRNECPSFLAPHSHLTSIYSFPSGGLSISSFLLDSNEVCSQASSQWQTLGRLKASKHNLEHPRTSIWGSCTQCHNISHPESIKLCQLKKAML